MDTTQADADTPLPSRRHPEIAPARRRSLACRLLLAAGSAVPSASFAADLEVRLPTIDVHELEYDQKFAVTRDRSALRRNEQSIVGELEYGFTNWWSTAIEGEWERPPNGDSDLGADSITWENRFQLTETGNRWLDAGLFIEYGRSVGGRSDELRAGPLLGKDFGEGTRAALNVLMVQGFDRNAGGGAAINYAFQIRHDLASFLAPGVEIYGGPERVEPANTRQDRHRGGPVLFGVFPLGDDQDVRYEIGYLVGFTPRTPEGTFKLLVGYERTF